MKDQLLNKLAAHQDELMEILNKCPEHGDREDLLQDWYMFIYEKNFPSFSIDNIFEGGKLNTGFVYITMKNFTLDKIRRASKKDEHMQDAYRTHYEVTELTEDSLADNLAYEGNKEILKELFKDVSDEDYADIIKIFNKELKASFTSSNGVDKNGYKKRWRQLTKIINKVKLDAKINYKYLTIDNISELSSYDDLNNININNLNK